MFGQGRKRLVTAIPIAVLLAGGLVVPTGAEERAVGDEARSDFPIYGEDKFLGSVNQFNNPMFTELFNQVAPENAGKWGVAAGTTQSAPMRWAQLDSIYNFAEQNGFPFRFHALLWGNQQPTWMRQLEPEEQLVEIDKWFAAVAERYPNIEWLEVVNEPTWDPPDCDDPKNVGELCNDAGDYLRALGGYNDTDGTGWDWILNAFRLARHHFPDTKLMINDVLITNSHEATTDYLEIIEVLQAEDLIDGIGVQGHAHVFTEGVPGPTVWRTGQLKRTWLYTRRTWIGSPRLACRSRSPSLISTVSKETECPACRGTRFSWRTIAAWSPPFGSIQASRGSPCGAGANRLTGGMRRTRRSCCRTTSSSLRPTGSSTTSTESPR
jgi:hypothetical protein